MPCACAGQRPDCADGCGPDLRGGGRFVPPWADAAYDGRNAAAGAACAFGERKWEEEEEHRRDVFECCPPTTGRRG